MTNNQFKNTHTVLSELLESLQEFADSIDFYFDHVDDGEILNPFLAGGKINVLGNNEVLPPEFFNGFGIRTLILDTLHGRLSLSERSFIDNMNTDASVFKWRVLKSNLVMEDLRMLFKNSQIVEFGNWSDVKNASDLWDNLRRDVINPLKRNDFHFIFYLGDTSTKFVFEIDEILDIIGDFSLHGSVTLVLEEQHAINLWSILYGRDARSEISNFQSLSEKCHSLFDLMDIRHLIIDSFPATLVFSAQQQFEITVRKNSRIVIDNRKHFDAGYMLGLILKFDISHAVALGLALEGLCAGSAYKPNARMLLSYIGKWIEEIEFFKPEERALSVA